MSELPCINLAERFGHALIMERGIAEPPRETRRGIELFNRPRVCGVDKDRPARHIVLNAFHHVSRRLSPIGSEDNRGEVLAPVHVAVGMTHVVLKKRVAVQAPAVAPNPGRISCAVVIWPLI